MDDDGLTILDVESSVLTGRMVARQRDVRMRERKLVVLGAGVDGSPVGIVGKLSPTGHLVSITTYRELRVPEESPRVRRLRRTWRKAAQGHPQLLRQRRLPLRDRECSRDQLSPLQRELPDGRHASRVGPSQGVPPVPGFEPPGARSCLRVVTSRTSGGTRRPRAAILERRRARLGDCA